MEQVDSSITAYSGFQPALWSQNHGLDGLYTPDNGAYPDLHSIRSSKPRSTEALEKRKLQNRKA
jgi:hypothetical protein